MYECHLAIDNGYSTALVPLYTEEQRQCYNEACVTDSTHLGWLQVDDNGCCRYAHICKTQNIDLRAPTTSCDISKSELIKNEICQPNTMLCTWNMDSGNTFYKGYGTWCKKENECVLCMLGTDYQIALGDSGPDLEYQFYENNCWDGEVKGSYGPFTGNITLSSYGTDCMWYGRGCVTCSLCCSCTYCYRSVLQCVCLKSMVSAPIDVQTCGVAYDMDDILGRCYDGTFCFEVNTGVYVSLDEVDNPDSIENILYLKYPEVCINPFDCCNICNLKNIYTSKRLPPNINTNLLSVSMAKEFICTNSDNTYSRTLTRYMNNYCPFYGFFRTCYCCEEEPSLYRYSCMNDFADIREYPELTCSTVGSTSIYDVNGTCRLVGYAWYTTGDSTPTNFCFPFGDATNCYGFNLCGCAFHFYFVKDVRPICYKTPNEEWVSIDCPWTHCVSHVIRLFNKCTAGSSASFINVGTYNYGLDDTEVPIETEETSVRGYLNCNTLAIDGEEL